jgi:hypothetical protein
LSANKEAVLMNTRSLFHALYVLTLCTGVSAQEHKHSPSKKPSTMNIPQPAPEMKKLAKMLVGTWRIDERVFPGPLAPNGATGKATETIRIGPGSTSILMDYKGTSVGNFTGHGITSWSPEKNVYESVWVDSMTPGGISTLTGTWAGENLIFTGKELTDGKRMQNRLTYSNIKPDAFTCTMEMGPDGGHLEKFMELRYKRAPSGTTRPRTPEPANQN